MFRLRIKLLFVVIFKCLIFDNCPPRGHWPPKVAAPHLPRTCPAPAPHLPRTCPAPVSIGSAQPEKIAYVCARAMFFAAFFVSRPLGAMPFWAIWWPSWGLLGSSWGHFGTMLGRPWVDLGSKMASNDPQEGHNKPQSNSNCLNCCTIPGPAECAERLNKHMLGLLHARTRELTASLNMTSFWGHFTSVGDPCMLRWLCCTRQHGN